MLPPSSIVQESSSLIRATTCLLTEALHEAHEKRPFVDKVVQVRSHSCIPDELFHVNNRYKAAYTGPHQMVLLASYLGLELPHCNMRRRDRRPMPPLYERRMMWSYRWPVKTQRSRTCA